MDGVARVSEVGESSTPVLPVTREPIHHTVPLLAARLARHEDRMDDIADAVEEIAPERIEGMEEEMASLVTHKEAVERFIQTLGSELEEASDMIAEFGR